MLPQQEKEILQHPEVQDAQMKLLAVGADVSLVDMVTNNAISGIGNEPTREAVKIVVKCLLKKLREFEKNREPTTFWGKLIKGIFG